MPGKVHRPAPHALLRLNAPYRPAMPDADPPRFRPEVYPLLQRYPALRARAPVAGLLTAATPITAIAGTPGLYVKRDDRSAPDYGGNKIRKLDFLLGAARTQGVRDIVCFGYAGSNFVAATAWHARKLGMTTWGYLLPQDRAAYVADNLAVSLAAGAELRLLPSMGAIGAAASLRSLQCLLQHGRWPRWIPPGGSSPTGVLGFINAALELEQQVLAGALPAPDELYVAFSSMGTVAGLAIGLALTALPTQLTAIQVVDDRFASPDKLDRLVRRSLRQLDTAMPSPPTADSALQRVRIRTEFFGEAYARPTAATRQAIERFERDSGIRADTAYTGKALAGLYADLDAGRLQRRTVLYWHSFNAQGRPPGVALPPVERVPAALRHYFAA
jgi:1-aminocyclopropane-1-carboxylate deaminase/D-cysteine desulfhydrase-like pyridoxal-dependent ACC family enzyme